MWRLAVALVLLLSTAWPLARADELNCRVVQSSDVRYPGVKGPTTVPSGTDVTVSALVECVNQPQKTVGSAKQAGRQAYTPQAGVTVVFEILRDASTVVTYGGVSCGSERSAAAPAREANTCPSDTCVDPCVTCLDPCGLAGTTPERQALSPKQDVGTYDLVYAATGSDGRAHVTITNLGVGRVSVITFADGGYMADTPLDIVWANPARLVLQPHVAKRHCGEPARVTARLLDDNDAPIANAEITFGVTGNCATKLSAKGKVGVTNADGYATLHLFSEEPCAMAVVAAAVNADGTPLLSADSKVIFEEDSYGVQVESKEDATTHAKNANAATKQALADIQAKPN